MRIIHQDEQDRKSEWDCIYWIIFVLFVISFCLCLIFNILCFTYDPYDNDDYNELISNWKKTPITSISINNNYLYNLNRKIKENDSENILKIFVFERMDAKYNYKYLLTEEVGNKDYHPCGTDLFGNYLFLPNEVECPINDIEISSSEFPNDTINIYKTIKLYDNLFLHYTNNNIDGLIINDINITISSYIQSDKFTEKIILNENIFPLLDNKTEFGFILTHYGGYEVIYDTVTEKRNLTAFNYKFNAKSYRILINILSLFLLVIIAICYILIIISRKFIGLHLLILFLIIIDFFIKYIVHFYLKDEFLIVSIESYDYDTIQLILIIIFIFFYLLFYNISDPKGNYFHLLIYIFRYGFNCEIFGCCFRKNIEKKNKKLIDLDKEIEDLNRKTEEYKKEKNNLIKEKKIIEKKIIKANELLDEKRKKNESGLNVLYIKEEEISFEAEIQNLLVIKKSEIENLNKIKEQIE